MKRILTVLGLFSLVACGGSGASTSTPSKEATPTTAEEVQTHMNFLTSDELSGREAGTEGIASAATYIEAFFTKHQIGPYFTTFKDTLTNYEPTAYNVIGYLPGTDPALANELIVIGAHYDHIGQGEAVGDDTIANGANDNATGTVTVMQLARYFAQRRGNKRPLMFALFSAEEKGLLGSRHLAARMNKEGKVPYLVLNFEMTGVPMTDKPYTTYLTGYDRSNLAEMMNGYSGTNLVGYLPTAKAYNLFMRSDNFPFFQEFGIPAHTFSTFDFTNFDHYHKVGDEASIIDAEHMSGLINAFSKPIELLVNDTQKVKKS